MDRAESIINKTKGEIEDNCRLCFKTKGTLDITECESLLSDIEKLFKIKIDSGHVCDGCVEKVKTAKQIKLDFDQGQDLFRSANELCNKVSPVKESRQSLRDQHFRQMQIRNERESPNSSSSTDASLSRSPISGRGGEGNTPDSQSPGETGSDASSRILPIPLTPGRLIEHENTISPQSEKRSNARERYSKFKRKTKKSLYVQSLIYKLKLSKFQSESVI